LGKNVRKPQGGFFDSHCTLALCAVVHGPIISTTAAGTDLVWLYIFGISQIWVVSKIG